jgi:hypothetical protein
MFTCTRIFVRSLCVVFFTLGWPPTQHTFFVSGFCFFNPVHFLYFVRAQPTQHFFCVLTFDCFVIVMHSFLLQWLPHITLLGTSAHQTFGLYLHFLKFPQCPMTILPTLSLWLLLRRLNFAHTMRRNLTSGSPHRGPICSGRYQITKTKNTPMLWPTCPSKSFWTF